MDFLSLFVLLSSVVFFFFVCLLFCLVSIISESDRHDLDISPFILYYGPFWMRPSGLLSSPGHSSPPWSIDFYFFDPFFYLSLTIFLRYFSSFIGVFLVFLTRKNEFGSILDHQILLLGCRGSFPVIFFLLLLLWLSCQINENAVLPSSSLSLSFLPLSLSFSLSPSLSSLSPFLPPYFPPLLTSFPPSLLGIESDFFFFSSFLFISTILFLCCLATDCW